MVNVICNDSNYSCVLRTTQDNDMILDENHGDLVSAIIIDSINQLTECYGNLYFRQKFIPSSLEKYLSDRRTTVKAFATKLSDYKKYAEYCKKENFKAITSITFKKYAPILSKMRYIYFPYRATSNDEAIRFEVEYLTDGLYDRHKLCFGSRLKNLDGEDIIERCKKNAQARVEYLRKEYDKYALSASKNCLKQDA